MRLLLRFLVVTAFMMSMISCKQKEPDKIGFTPSFSTFNQAAADTSDPNAKQETYYGLLTPMEITVIFNRLSLPYNKVSLNPSDNSDYYLSTSKAALNTGIYGVDFGYLKMFGMGQEVIDYVVTIKDMSNKLGIPDALIVDLVKRVRNDISNRDTVTAMMEKAYMDIESHLRESGRESTAGLMILGGWVEAMYLATQLAYDPAAPDAMVVQKIAEQKYTLNSLLSFMKNYYDDPVVVYYTKKLIYLRKYFDSFDIYFEKGDLEIDTNEKVLRSSGAQMTITVQNLNDIRDYVAKLRGEMVSY